MRLLCTTLVLALMSLDLGGCATTAVWADAAQKEAVYPEFIIAYPAMAHHGEKLIFEYQTELFAPGYFLEAHRNYIVEIELEKSGVPSEPFAYHGSGVQPEEIEKDLTREQIARITQYRFKAIADHNAMPPHARTLPMLDQSLVMVFDTAFDGLPGNATPRQRVLLPYVQYRPAGELAKASTVAAVLTPFTVVIDVVTFPLQAVYAVTHR